MQQDTLAHTKQVEEVGEMMMMKKHKIELKITDMVPLPFRTKIYPSLNLLTYRSILLTCVWVENAVEWQQRKAK